MYACMYVCIYISALGNGITYTILPSLNINSIYNFSKEKR